MNDYKNSITVSAKPDEVVELIGRVPAWWGADFQGHSEQVCLRCRFQAADRRLAKVSRPSSHRSSRSFLSTKRRLQLNRTCTDIA